MYVHAPGNGAHALILGVHEIDDLLDKDRGLGSYDVGSQYLS